MASLEDYSQTIKQLSASVTAHRFNITSPFPLLKWKQWTPNFKINALGIIALLGTEEINKSVGRLVKSKVLEYLPVMGSSTFASDAFATKQPGFQLYNFNDAIYTPDLAGWFARWLMAQNFRTASSCIEWSISTNPKPFVSSFWNWASIIVGFVMHAAFITTTALMSDWWGCANASSMALSTLTRAYLLAFNRMWLDKAVDKCIEDFQKDLTEKSKQATTANAEADSVPAASGETKETSISSSETSDGSQQPVLTRANAIEKINKDQVKILIVLSDARAVALLIPRCLVRDCFVLTPKPQHSKDGETRRTRLPSLPSRTKEVDRQSESANIQFVFYKLVRWIAWLAFAGQVVTIGMSDLASQIITVVLIGIPTFCIVQKWGCDDTQVGSTLVAKTIDIPHPTADDKRVDIYAFLNLNDGEKSQEQTLLEVWHLAPHRESAKGWWKNYDKVKGYYNLDRKGNPSPLMDLKSYTRRKEELDRRTARQESTSRVNTLQEAEKHVGHDTT